MTARDPSLLRHGEILNLGASDETHFFVHDEEAQSST